VEVEQQPQRQVE
jgi:hypothetical protein